MFAPAGPVAAQDLHILTVVVLAMAIVVLPVLVLTPWIAWRYRLGNRSAAYQPKWAFSWPLEVVIWGIPAAIVMFLSTNLWRQTHTLDPYRPIASALPPLQVQAVGLDWKWLFIYPAQGIATLNELAFPAGQPVHISITSDTVMQSLFIPRLAGQIYAMPGMTTQLNIMAFAPGAFTGENTQFNGMGFQDQHFAARALAPTDFTRWVDHAKAAGTALDPAAFATIARKSTVPSPVYFAPVPDNLFTDIIRRARG